MSSIFFMLAAAAVIGLAHLAAYMVPWLVGGAVADHFGQNLGLATSLLLLAIEGAVLIMCH